MLEFETRIGILGTAGIPGVNENDKFKKIKLKLIKK